MFENITRKQWIFGSILIVAILFILRLLIRDVYHGWGQTVGIVTLLLMFLFALPLGRVLSKHPYASFWTGAVVIALNELARSYIY